MKPRKNLPPEKLAELRQAAYDARERLSAIEQSGRRVREARKASEDAADALIDAMGDEIEKYPLAPMTTPQPQPHPAPLTLEQALALPDEELRVRVAEIAGWRKEAQTFRAGCWVDPEGNTRGRSDLALPPYPNSHDALAPVIAGLSDLDHFKYRIHLAKVVNHSLPFNPEANIEELRAISMARGRAFHDATPRQKAVAVIMAKQKPSLPVVPAQGPPITQADIDAAQEDE